MSAVSIELVPRSAASVRADVAALGEHFPGVRLVNIPDLLRFPLRSWDACALARESLPRAIPHLRAVDFQPKDALALAQRLRERGLRDALVVRGETPQELGRPMYATRSEELIAALREADPELRVYAAFDPYRRGLQAELDAARAKLAAGAHGFFTQPFFDLRWLELCAEQLAGHEVFWGLSPVTTSATLRYWQVRNAVVFPERFEPTLAWSRSFAAQVLAWAHERDASLYFMPIRVALRDYLAGLL